MGGASAFSSGPGLGLLLRWGGGCFSLSLSDPPSHLCSLSAQINFKKNDGGLNGVGNMSILTRFGHTRDFYILYFCLLKWGFLSCYVI